MESDRPRQHGHDGDSLSWSDQAGVNGMSHTRVLKIHQNDTKLSYGLTTMTHQHGL